jgi:pimeloyl-ACP methyl ester carboxylesterase
LLFLPGTLCTQATFSVQAAQLQDCASAVRVIPLLHGSSITASAQWILEQLTEPVALVGFSQGAIVALEIMRQAPERVIKLCLMSTNPKAATPAQLETWQTWQQEVREGKFNEVIERFANNVHPERRNDPKLRETILSVATETGPEVFMTQLQALASRIDSRPYLPNISCPTLLLVGRQDTVTPLEFHQEMQQLIPNATLVPIEDCGHYVPLEQPQAVTALLRYWLQT